MLRRWVALGFAAWFGVRGVEVSRDRAGASGRAGLPILMTSSPSTPQSEPRARAPDLAGPIELGRDRRMSGDPEALQLPRAHECSVPGSAGEGRRLGFAAPFRSWLWSCPTASSNDARTAPALPYRARVGKVALPRRRRRRCSAPVGTGSGPRPHRDPPPLDVRTPHPGTAAPTSLDSGSRSFLPCGIPLTHNDATVRWA